MPGVLAKIADCFGKNQVSIATVIQKESDGKSAFIVFMTHETQEMRLKSAISEIEKLDVVEAVENVFVVLDEGMI